MTSEWSTNKNGAVGKMCIGYKCNKHWCLLHKYNKNKSRKDGLNNRCKYCRKKHYRDNRVEVLKRESKYVKSDRGKLTRAKLHAKERGLGFNPIYNNILDEPYVWHHPNDNDVVALPRDLHYLYNAYCYSLGLKGHRFMLNQIIKQIYGGLL